MSRKIQLIALLLAAVLALSGCAMATLSDLYCLPKRSEEYENLQAVIDKAMVNLSYSAPMYGDNRQVVQVADLDGDGVDEYLLFAKDDSDKPLKILIFCQLASGYVLMDTIEGYGFAYDFVTYAQMDDKPGVELIVGRQVSSQVMGSVSVYRFTSGFSRLLMNTSYSQLLTTDLDNDGIGELFLLNPGAAEKSHGTAILYRYTNGEFQRSSEIRLSAPVKGFKQMMSGILQDGLPVIYVTCASDNNSLVTDIFTLEGENFVAPLTNISIPALQNYYVYPEDVDDDNVLELPHLIPLKSLYEDERQEYIIEWYSLSSDGEQNCKRCTYHNYIDNWYLELDRDVHSSISVVQTDVGTEFYYNEEIILTIATLTDADRLEQSKLPGWITLYSTETVIYVAYLEENAAELVDAKDIIARFYPIRVDLNTEKDGKT